MLRQLLTVLCLHLVTGEYLITTPQKWISGDKAKVCLSTPGPLTPGYVLSLSVSTANEAAPRQSYWKDLHRSEEDPTVSPVVLKQLLSEIPDVKFETGSSFSCSDVLIDVTTSKYGEVKISGSINGSPVNETRPIRFIEAIERIFIEPSQYIYKDGQLVEFRVLTLTGPSFKISYEPYHEIYVETPTSSRIRQWLNVSNTDGLLHKHFFLLDEAEHGTYTIFVRKNKTDELTRKTFKVEDFVLPRFDVSISPLKSFLATDSSLNLKVCAQYTYGQPLKGQLVGFVDNGGYRKRKFKVDLTESIDGCKNVIVDITPMKINGYRTIAERLNVELQVIEDGTGNTVEESSTIPIIRVPIKMENMRIFKYRKPEIPYVMSVRVTDEDDKPVPTEPISLCVSEKCSNTTTGTDGFLKFSIPPHIDFDEIKITALNYPTKKVEEPNRSYGRIYMYGAKYEYYSKSYFSPSNSSLQILPPIAEEIACLTDRPVSVNLTVLYSSSVTGQTNLNVMGVSKGQIKYSKIIPVNFEDNGFPSDLNLLFPMEAPITKGVSRGHMEISLEIPDYVSPEFKLLVWYTRDDGEVVADSHDLKVEECLNNRVKMSWSAPKLGVGQTASVTVEAEPNSFCSLGVIDKSMELLSKGRESISVPKVFKMVESTQPDPVAANQVNNYEFCKEKLAEEETLVRRKRFGFWNSPLQTDYLSNYVDATQMFDNAGVFVMSNLKYETRPCTTALTFIGDRGDGGLIAEGRITFYDQLILDSPGGGSNAQPELETNYIEETDTELSVPRQYFPENFIWELFQVKQDGFHTHSSFLPDTITEWSGKTVCVHPERGIGISNKASIIAFSPFFIDITLPPTIQKGEVMPVAISMFNYLDTALPVRLNFMDYENYEIVGDIGKVAEVYGSKTLERKLCAPAKDKAVWSLQLRPNSTGYTSLSILATVDSTFTECQTSGDLPAKEDIISKSIYVDYEGFPKEKVQSKYICVNSTEQGVDAKWKMEIPVGAEIVADSGRDYVTVVGDLMGPTLDNIKNLITVPSGCGEQNMIKFVPNIFVYDYLEATDQLTPVSSENLKYNMAQGYLTQLRYRHADGSFSVFGKRDSSGSTWLTAFVVKAFGKAQEHIPIDKALFQETVQWLADTQIKENDTEAIANMNTVGCFRSKGKVLHKNMKGGLSSDSHSALLTSYVIGALSESRTIPHIDEVITNAVACINRAPETNDPYELALKAYALTSLYLEAADAAIQKLLDVAENATDTLYWKIPNSDGTYPDVTPPVAVETAGYAVITMLNKDFVKYWTPALKIVKWISNQRNSQGGFISTQDTVIALQALTYFENYRTKEPLDMMVNILSTAPDGTKSEESFQVSKDNRLLTQRTINSTPMPYNIDISTNGTGCTLVQAVIRYNQKNVEASKAFDVYVNLCPGTRSKSLTLQACTSYLLSDKVSNMAIMEVSLISGYVPLKDYLEILLEDGIIKRYEVDGRKVIFYFEELSQAKKCVNFEILKEADIANAKPGSVKVFDYYKPELFITETFEAIRQGVCSTPQN